MRGFSTLQWLGIAVWFAVSLTVHASDLEYSAETLLNDFIAQNGARPAGSDAERQAADWIENRWRNLGLAVSRQPFSYPRKKQTVQSQNLWVDLPGKSKRVMVVAAHYDSTGRGSEGVIDNGAGVAVLLSLTQALIRTELPYSVRLIVFGAEEEGLRGAKTYVESINEQHKARLLGMVNLDTIAGGDILYIHSAHSTPYNCEQGTKTYASQTWLRDALLARSNTLFAAKAHQIHPAYPDFPKGQTGGWSDHAPFACMGLPIAYLEATNFTVNGKNGFDGYSQTTHDALWNCFDVQKKSACERRKEFKWGQIWHTHYDTLKSMNTLFPGRLVYQMQQSQDVLFKFLSQDITSALP